MRRILPSLAVILFLASLAALITMPLNTASNENPLTQADAKSAWDAFLKWQEQQLPSPIDQQNMLKQLETKHPESYHFSLERLRGKEQQTIIKDDHEKLSILAKSALKALSSKEEQNLLKELKNAKNDRENGFGLISAKYKTNWGKIVRAIASKDKKALRRFLPATP